MSGDLVHIEKLYNDRLWVIQIYALDTGSVDAIERGVRAYINSVPDPLEQYTVYDLLSIKQIGLTTYMRQRVVALLEDYPTARGRLGMAMTLNPLRRYVFEPFIRFTGQRIQPNVDVRLFGSRAEAIQWVVAGLPPQAHSTES